MSVEQRMVIDAISTAPSGRCVLTIFDHLAWEDQKHLPMLQEKINDYLGFIQSGQLLQSRPDVRGRELEIRVICQVYPRSEVAVRFLGIAGETLRRAKVHFSWMELPKTQE